MADPKLIARLPTRPFPKKGRIGILKPEPSLFADFVYFSQRQYDSLDYDPFHPMLWHLSKGLDREHALWLSALYMAYYSIGSAHVAFQNSDLLRMPPEWALKLPIGVQRRNLRGGMIRSHLESFIVKCRRAGSIWKYLTQRFSGIEREDWLALNTNVGNVWGNGRWSTYTSSELFQKVNKVPVLPFDIMNDGSTGPRGGLCYMYSLIPPAGGAAVPLLDELTYQFFRLVSKRLKTNIPYLHPGHYDYGMLESQLCDFNSLRKGRYYVGRDIDRDQDRLRACEHVLRCLGKPDGVLTAVREARKAVFDKRYLGEISGWTGRTDEAKQYYRKTGQVADRMEINEALLDGRMF